MSPSRRRCAASVSAGALLFLAAAAPAAGFDAEPYKLVRSLQRIQDQIADGDKSAVAMQRDLSHLIDDGFNRLDPSEFADPRTAQALISYAMLGGNPATLQAHIAEIGDKDNELVRLAAAILAYQKGGARTAEYRLKDVDPRGADGLFGAELALVRGLVSSDDEQARTDFDTARLLAPGTLIEEAALRRLMTIHRRRQDAHSFLRVASRYARRYIGSPYATQFAQEFVAGVVALAGSMDIPEVMEIIEFLPEPYRSAVTVRLMRNATVAGNTGLVSRVAALVQADTADRDKADPDPARPEIDARQQFYSQIAQVTSENVAKVADQLRQMDDSGLPEGDRELRKAVIAVAAAVTDPEPLVDTSAPQRPDRDSIFRDTPKNQTEPVLPDFNAFVDGTRQTLQDVDKLLEDMQ